MVQNFTTMMLPDLVLLVGNLGIVIGELTMIVHKFKHPQN
jgi:hypothetical protein